MPSEPEDDMNEPEIEGRAVAVIGRDGGNLAERKNGRVVGGHLIVPEAVLAQEKQAQQERQGTQQPELAPPGRVTHAAMTCFR